MRAALERRRLAEETHKVEIAVLVPDDPSAHVDVALQLEVLIADPEVRRELAEKAEAARIKAEEMAREAEERAVRAAEARKEAEKMAKTLPNSLIGYFIQQNEPCEMRYSCSQDPAECPPNAVELPGFLVEEFGMHEWCQVIEQRSYDSLRSIHSQIMCLARLRSLGGRTRGPQGPR